ncbi:hypothetical protein ACLOJK_025352 [Asimina triloba]
MVGMSSMCHIEADGKCLPANLTGCHLTLLSLSDGAYIPDQDGPSLSNHVDFAMKQKESSKHRKAAELQPAMVVGAETDDVEAITPKDPDGETAELDPAGAISSGLGGLGLDGIVSGSPSPPVPLGDGAIAPAGADAGTSGSAAGAAEMVEIPSFVVEEIERGAKATKTDMASRIGMVSHGKEAMSVGNGSSWRERKLEEILKGQGKRGGENGALEDATWNVGIGALLVDTTGHVWDIDKACMFCTQGESHL